MASEKVQHLNESDFDNVLRTTAVPVLVDFWAEWCGPCRMIAPAIDELAGELDGRAVVAKVNVDESPNVAVRYGIRSIPMLLVFKGGEVVDSALGVQPKSALKQMVERHT